MRQVQLLLLWVTACGGKSALLDLGPSGGRVAMNVTASTGGVSATTGDNSSTTVSVAAGTGGVSGIVRITGPQEFVASAISYGGEDACALVSDGTVRCWGSNNNAQLGIGYFARSDCYCSSIPGPVTSLVNVVNLATGDSHVCAALGDGTMRCWGLDITGELGNGATYPPGPPGTIGAVPLTVLNISSASAVAVGHQHTCALLGDGTVQCWGFNSYGSLGNGTFEFSLQPVSVLGITNAVAIAAGGYNSCALLSDGTVQCWGSNMEGQLGNGTTYEIVGQADSSSTPVTVTGITTAVGVAVSGGACCALLRDGAIQCWGFGYGYASSNPMTNIPIELSPDVPGYVSASFLPAAVQGVTNAVSLSYGCAVLSDRTVQCWHTDAVQGTDSSGYSDPSVSAPPVVISGITNAVGVSGDVNSGCVLLDGGRVQCWGTNGSGQLGDGTTTDSDVPVTVLGF